MNSDPTQNYLHIASDLAKAGPMQFVKSVSRTHGRVTFGTQKHSAAPDFIPNDKTRKKVCQIFQQLRNDQDQSKLTTAELRELGETVVKLKGRVGENPPYKELWKLLHSFTPATPTPRGPLLHESQRRETLCCKKPLDVLEATKWLKKHETVSYNCCRSSRVRDQLFDVSYERYRNGMTTLDAFFPNSDGWHWLHKAAFLGDFATLGRLIGDKVAVNTSTRMGHTALHLVRDEHRGAACTGALLTAGANTEFENFDRRTPAAMWSVSRDEVLDLLWEWGAKIPASQVDYAMYDGSLKLLTTALKQRKEPLDVATAEKILLNRGCNCENQLDAILKYGNAGLPINPESDSQFLDDLVTELLRKFIKPWPINALVKLNRLGAKANATIKSDYLDGHLERFIKEGDCEKALTLLELGYKPKFSDNDLLKLIRQSDKNHRLRELRVWLKDDDMSSEASSEE